MNSYPLFSGEMTDADRILLIYAIFILLALIPYVWIKKK